MPDVLEKSHWASPSRFAYRLRQNGFATERFCCQVVNGGGTRITFFETCLNEFANQMNIVGLIAFAWVGRFVVMRSMCGVGLRFFVRILYV